MGGGKRFTQHETTFKTDEDALSNANCRNSSKLISSEEHPRFSFDPLFPWERGSLKGRFEINLTTFISPQCHPQIPISRDQLNTVKRVLSFGPPKINTEERDHEGGGLSLMGQISQSRRGGNKREPSNKLHGTNGRRIVNGAVQDP